MTNIRLANAEDAQGIARVNVQSWRETYAGIVPQDYLNKLSADKRAATWFKMLSDQKLEHICFVAESSKNEIVGFVDGGKARQPEHGYSGELYAIYLLQAFQGQGLGKALFNELVRHLFKMGFDSMYLWALEANPTVGFYKAAGGVFKKSTDIKIAEVKLQEDMYVWPEIGK